MIIASSSALPSAGPTSTLPAPVTDPTALRRWLAAIETRLDQEPDDIRLRQHAVQLLRALGEFGRARQLGEALTDEAFRRTKVVLSGAPVTWTDRAGPTPFVLVEDFLDAEQQNLLWELTDHPEADFATATVKGAEGEFVRPQLRQASVLRGAGPRLKHWFLPLLECALERERVLPRLGLPNFEVGRRDIQVTRHDDGDFLWMHRDIGPAHPLRLVSYVYYFHRRPRGFDGGELLLFDETPAGRRDGPTAYSRIVPADNRLVLFPSNRLHAVTRVVATGAGPNSVRWTVNGWLNR